MSKKNTDELIDSLCDDLDTVKYRSPYRLMLAWLVGAVLYLIFIVNFLGLRSDFDMRAMNPVYIFEIGLAALIFISSFIASSWLSVPDCMQRQWIKFVPIVLSAAFILWAVVRSIEEGMWPSFNPHLVHCAEDGMLMEAIPLVVLIFITMRGRTTQPFWSMGMDVLAVSTLGWIGLRLTCSIDEMGHSLFNHLLPFAVLSAAIGMFARKLFKW